MRRLLVTGGAGFIGSNFIRYWIDRHPEDRVVNLDALTYAGNPENLADIEAAPGYRFEHGDITDGVCVAGVFADEAIDTVVNFAAESHVDRSILGPEAFISTNVQGTFTLLEAARTAWGDFSQGQRFLHVSTDEVYGSLAANDPPFTESHAYAPNSPYSATKAASDHLVRAWHHTWGLPVLTTNCSNNYGPYQFPEKLIPLVILNALEGKPIPVYGDGQNVRDWLYVEDHCRGIEAVIERGIPGEVYNIGGGREMPNLELVKLLLGRLGKPESLIEFVPDRPGHDRRYAISYEKLKRELGWQPQVSFEDGIASTIDWYLNNQAWLDAIANGTYQAGYKQG